MSTYQHRRPLLGYFVSGYSAAWIDFQLRPMLLQQIQEHRRCGKSAAADALEVTMAGIAEAAKAYQARITEDRADEPKPLMVAPAPAAQRQTADYLTPKQAAEQLGVGERQARNLLKAGQLHGSMIGNRWMVDPASIEEYKFRKDVA